MGVLVGLVRLSELENQFSAYSARICLFGGTVLRGTWLLKYYWFAAARWLSGAPELWSKMTPQTIFISSQNNTFHSRAHVST
jgi:hypothetical protein